MMGQYALNLLQAAKKARLINETAKKNPLRFFRPSRVQRQVLEAEEPIVLFRAANQLGKTMVGAAECLYAMIGNHPYKELKSEPPITVWTIVHTVLGGS